MARSRRVLVIAAAVAALPVAGSLLAGEQSQLHVAVGEAPLCRAGVSLGRVVLATESAWRVDQKDPSRRAAIWESALRDVDRRASPCAAVVSRVLTEPGLTDSAALELSLTSAEPIDSVILVRAYEVGPNLVLGPLPPHWLGWTEAEFSARALEVSSGELLYDAHIRLARGGLFALRGERALERDAFDALSRLLGADLMSDDARLVR